MAKAKKPSRKTKPARGRKTAARKPAKKKAARSAGRSAAPSAASKRVAELESENRRLRDEVASLRAQLGDRPAAETPPEEPGEQSTLEL